MKKETKQFNLELLQGKNVAVNYITEEQAQDFVNWVSFLNSKSPSEDTRWKIYKKDTCYSLSSDLFWFYADIKGYKDMDYKIISYEEALLNEPKQNSKPIIRQEFIQKVKTEKIGVICNSVEELEVWYDFLDGHMNKNLRRPLKSYFISKDMLNYIISNATKYGANIEYNANNGFYEREGFTIYNFNDIIYQRGEVIKPKEDLGEVIKPQEDLGEVKDYLVYVKGKGQPKVRHTYENAIKEAKRLSAKEIGFEVNVVQILKTFKSEVIVNEIKEK